MCVPADDGLPLAECAKFCLGPAPPPPPTCAEGPADSRGPVLQLACPAGGVITAVTFAQYGLISGTCPSFTNTGCAADVSKPVESACIGQSSCTVNCDHSCCPLHPWCCGCTFTSGSNKTRQYVNVSDPLPHASKTQAVQVACNNSQPKVDSRQAVAKPATSLPGTPVSSGTTENNVAYFSWYSYTGCDQGRLGEPGCFRNLSASPSAAHRNLATDGDLAFLRRTHDQFSIPGMLLLQNSKWRAGVFGENLTGLQPGWEVAVDDCIATLVPLAKGNGGYIHGVQLGDEMVCGSVKNFSFENLSALAARLRDALHPHGVFVFTNECAGTPGQWSQIPAGLDVISLDAYADGASEAAMAKQFYERFLSKLKPHQSVWLVPGVFGFNATGPSPTNSHLRKCWATVVAETDESLVEKMSAYWAWADADPRITGVIPWHWCAAAKTCSLLFCQCPVGFELTACLTSRRWAGPILGQVLLPQNFNWGCANAIFS